MKSNSYPAVRYKLLVGVLVLFCVLFSSSYALNDDLDTDFHQAKFGGYAGEITDIEYYSDGSYLVAGWFTLSGSDSATPLVRVSADGSVDESFSQPVVGRHDPIRSVSIMENGKIVIGGDFKSVNGETRRGVARLLPSGDLDLEFSDPAIEKDSAYGSTFNQVTDVIVNDLGSIFVGGRFSRVNGVELKTIVKLTSDGSVDPDFLPLEIRDHNGTGEIRDFHLQSDGKLLVAGYFNSVDGVARAGAMRLNADGSLDLSFTPPPNLSYLTTAVATTPSGKILYSGLFNGANDENGYFRTSKIIRLNTDGTIDREFSVEPVSKSGGYTSYGRINEIEVSETGNIIIVGDFELIGNQSRNSIAVLNYDGALDPGFPNSNINSSLDVLGAYGQKILAASENLEFSRVGSPSVNRAGIVGLDFNGAVLEDGAGLIGPYIGCCFVSFVEIEGFQEADGGKYFTYGNFNFVDSTPYDSVARFLPDGTLDSSFINLGISGRVMDMARNGEGKYMIVGNFSFAGNVPVSGIAILNPDGTLDEVSTRRIPISSWSRGGYFNAVEALPSNEFIVLEDDGVKKYQSDGNVDNTFTTLDLNSGGRTIAIQSNGKIIVGGSFSNVDGQNLSRLARLNPDGSLDHTFVDHGVLFDKTRYVSQILILRDGNILIGSSTYGGYDGIAGREYLFRIQSNGEFDDSFDYMTTSSIHSLIQSSLDGSVYGGGNSIKISTGDHRSFFKLFENGSIDEKFRINVVNQRDATAQTERIFLHPNGSLLSSISAPYYLEAGGSERVRRYINNKSNVEIDPSENTVIEGNSGETTLNYQIERSIDIENEFSISYSIGTRSASLNEHDFFGGLPSGTIEFSSGETTEYLQIKINGDEEYENNEEFSIIFDTEDIDINFVNSEVKVTIINDDTNPDSDGDGVLDDDDNCPLISNPDQSNNDGDSEGDACDTDDDNDGASDNVDNCPFIANPSQLNTDLDAFGNACDDDDDNDGVLDTVDICPINADPSQADFENDGIGDACDPDDDNDGMSDAWEIKHGLNPHGSWDRDEDPDGDGLTNLEEYESGRDPNVADADKQKINIVPILMLLLDEEEATLP